MELYIVGGFVRDRMLGLDPKDKDYLFVGATVDEVLAFGKEHDLDFKQVGADFPVFLDKHGQEWALARKERKVGKGYKGFECDFDPSVTLEDDLFRRDLTINAMALEVLRYVKGDVDILDIEVQDPFHGLTYLRSKTLHRVSKHFAEDPVRVLRVARFAARYGFKVSQKTLQLMRNMCDSGELDHLVPERVWAETEKALSERNPNEFFLVLAKVGAGDVLFPKVMEHMSADVANAMMNTCNVKERVAILFSNMNENDVKHVLNKEFFPSKVAKFALNFNKFLEILDRHNHKLTSALVVHVFTHFGVYQNKKFLEEVENVISTFYNKKLELLMDALLVVFHKTLEVGYDELPEKDRMTLQGANIGKAIWNLRKEVIRSLV